MSGFVANFYFSVRGRTSRRFYWSFGFCGLVAVGLLAGFVIGVASRFVSQQLILLLIAVLAVQAVWSATAIHAKRLHDIGLSAYWLLVAWAIAFAIAYSVSLRAGQLASLVTWIVIGAIPGTRGVNRFGPDPTMPLQQESEPNDVPAA